MHCYVYRSLKKKGLYVYIPVKGDFTSLSPAIKKAAGELEFTLELELDENRKLASEDPIKVIQNIENNGFHIQMPSDIEPVLAAISQAHGIQGPPE